MQQKMDGKRVSKATKKSLKCQKKFEKPENKMNKLISRRLTGAKNKLASSKMRLRKLKVEDFD